VVVKLQNLSDPIPNPSPEREGRATAVASAVGVLPIKGELEGVWQLNIYWG